MKTTLSCLAIVAFSALPAAAQEKGQLGIDFAVGSGSSETLGVTVHVSKRFALRPLFQFDHASTGSTQTLTARDGSVDVTTSTTGTGFAAGLEPMLFVARNEAFSIYVGATYERLHSSSEGDAPVLSRPLGELPPQTAEAAAALFPPISSRQVTDSDVFGAALGAQYAFNKRVSVFGEVGLRDSKGDSSLTRTPFPAGSVSTRSGPSSSKRFGTLTSALGVIFYVK